MRACRYILAALSLALLPLRPAPTRAADAQPSELPRYQFPVGRKLTWTWSGASTSANEKRESKSGGTIELTAVRANPDGSSRVVVRYIPMPKKDKEAAEDEGSFRYGDAFPDGRVLPDESLDFLTDDLSQIIPPLPADAAQASHGWTESRPEKQEETAYAPKPAAAPDEFVFTANVGGVLKKIYLVNRASTFRFDRARGVITSIDGTYSQDYGFHTRGTITTKLASDVTIAAPDAAALAADLDLFIKTKLDYRKGMRELEKATPDKADALGSAALDLLKHARASAKTAVVGGELDKMLGRHDAYAKDARESAEEFKAILDKPSPDWATTDIDGRPVKLADFRGKVVVMDFWYRGCGFCMYAMPQVKQLAEDYRDKPVVVLSMNTDLKDEDARFVVEAFGLRHPTIKAKGINDKYGIHGFPTMVIIDPAGVVRDVHVGYSKTLRSEVSKKIDEALAKPAADAGGGGGGGAQPEKPAGTASSSAR
jgi:thiol-disulfide isomerase/thioredoxin